MLAANNYLTLLQLGVGFNLVVGAYGSHRKNIENKIEDEIEASREKINEIIDHKNPPILEIEPHLEKKKIELLPERHLVRYLGDVSIRFHRRCYCFGQRDKIVEPCLVPIGLLCLAGLIYASLWPKVKVSDLVVYVSLVIGFLPALWAFMRLMKETAEHERFYLRQVDSSYGPTVVAKHEERVRSAAVDGEMFKVMNRIRVLHREHVKKTRTANQDGARPETERS